MHLMGALQGIPKKQIPFPRHHSGPGTGARVGRFCFEAGPRCVCYASAQDF